MSRNTYVPATVRHRRFTGRGVDEVAVERAVQVGGTPLYPEEMTAAVRHLTRTGLSARLIAVRLGTTTRTVVRHRNP